MVKRLRLRLRLRLKLRLMFSFRLRLRLKLKMMKKKILLKGCKSQTNIQTTDQEKCSISKIKNHSENQIVSQKIKRQEILSVYKSYLKTYLKIMIFIQVQIISNSRMGGSYSVMPVKKMSRLKIPNATM